MAFSFGTTPAAAPTTAGFGFATAPTAATTFGSTTNATTGAFGSSVFGAAPAGTSAPANPFGAATPQPAAPQSAPQTSFSGGTPYTALPLEVKQAIDTIHDSIMKHKRIMLSLQSMAPKALLEVRGDPLKMGTGAHGKDLAHSSSPLAASIFLLHQNIATLEQDTGLQTLAGNCKDDYETLLKQAYMHGFWQIENLAVRRGIHLKQQQRTHQPDHEGNAGSSIQALLDGELRSVDRLEKMPSPYFWAIVEDLEQRLHNLKHNALTVQQQIQNSLRSEEPADIPSLVQSQHRALYRVSSRLEVLSQQIEQLRQQYRFYEKGENVLEKAQIEEQQRHQRLHNRIQLQYVQAAANSTQAGAPATIGTIGAPSTTTGTFGTTTPAPSFGAFGSTPVGTIGAPTPTTGAFGTTPSPAPSFGFTSSTPATTAAPAPATTNPFGGSTAPSPAFNFGGFGSTPATSATGGFVTASSTSSTPKSSSKNKSRKGRK